MYREDHDFASNREKQSEDVYSKSVRAGKRTYFFDVKSTKGSDYYLTITESKRRVEDDGRFVFDKHKIFLYKEDFIKFAEGLQDAVEYVRANCPLAVEERVPEERQEGADFSSVSFEEL